MKSNRFLVYRSGCTRTHCSRLLRRFELEHADHTRRDSVVRHPGAGAGTNLRTSLL
jgi:hypothetical protein